MADLPTDPPTDALPEPEASLPEPSPALIEAELDRLAASDSFVRSTRHVKLLRHLAALALRGDHAGMREMSLGVAVFGRDAASFDPRADSIVRVEARRLRQRLTAYYANEGQDARVEFHLPVGSYRLSWLRRVVPPPMQRTRASVAVFDFGLDPDGLVPPPGSAEAALTAEFSQLLARLNGLRVVMAGRASTAPDAAARDAARALGVGTLLHGRVAAGGQQPRLALSLSQVDDGALMWAGTEPYDAAAPTLGLLPLARQLIAVLHRDAERRKWQRIGPAERRRVPEPRSSTALSESLALARAAMLRHTVEGYRRAVALAEQATALDPGCAEAHALHADARMALAGITAVPSQPELVLAEAAAQRALALDPDCSAAHSAMGQLRLLVHHDWPGAEARLLAALRTAPGDAATHARYGWALMMRGRYAEARAAYLEARDLNPLSLLYRTHEALIAIYERRWDPAAQGLAAVLDVAPEHLIALALRGAMELYRNDVAAAEATYAGLSRQVPALSIGLCGLAQVEALRGDRASAEVRLQDLIARVGAGTAPPYQVAMVQARLGRLDAAAEWLDRSAAANDFNFVCAGVDPCFDALRATPTGSALLRKYGMAELVGPRSPGASGVP
jgi:serine/threonine-protein kinase